MAEHTLPVETDFQSNKKANVLWFPYPRHQLNCNERKEKKINNYNNCAHFVGMRWSMNRVIASSQQNAEFQVNCS